jgi:hypothetical protein
MATNFVEPPILNSPANKALQDFLNEDKSKRSVNWSHRAKSWVKTFEIVTKLSNRPDICVTVKPFIMTSSIHEGLTGLTTYDEFVSALNKLYENPYKNTNRTFMNTVYPTITKETYDIVIKKAEKILPSSFPNNTIGFDACKKSQIMVVPVYIWSVTRGLEKDFPFLHGQVLVINNTTKEAIIIEPLEGLHYGSVGEENSKRNIYHQTALPYLMGVDVLKKLVKTLTGEEYRIVEAGTECPQSLNSSKPDCVYWALIMYHALILNTDLPYTTVIKELMKRVKNDPNYVQKYLSWMSVNVIPHMSLSGGYSRKSHTKTQRKTLRKRKTRKSY